MDIRKDLEKANKKIQDNAGYSKEQVPLMEDIVEEIGQIPSVAISYVKERLFNDELPKELIEAMHASMTENIEEPLDINVPGLGLFKNCTPLILEPNSNRITFTFEWYEGEDNE